MLTSVLDNYTIHDKNQKSKNRHDIHVLLLDNVPTLVLHDVCELTDKKVLSVRTTAIDLTRISDITTDQGVVTLHGEKHLAKIIDRKMPANDPALLLIPTQKLHITQPNSASTITVPDHYGKPLADIVNIAKQAMAQNQKLTMPNYMSRRLLIPNFTLASKLVKAAKLRLRKQGRIIAFLPSIISLIGIGLLIAATSLAIITLAQLPIVPQTQSALHLVAICAILAALLLTPIAEAKAQATLMSQARQEAHVNLHQYVALIREENKRYLLISQDSKDPCTIRETLVLIGGEDRLPTHRIDKNSNIITFKGDGIWQFETQRQGIWQELIPSRDIPHMKAIPSLAIADTFLPTLCEITKRAAKL
jgi:hypothetical protein